jgi:RNA polymerase sigma-54 factor
MQMAMGMGMEQQMRASPALVALNNMLVLTTLELQQLVQQELADNPALEHVEAAELQCEICGRPLQDGVCFACLRADYDLRAAESELAPRPEREIDPLLSVPAPLSPLEALERDLRVAVPAADATIADYLIGSLDSRGFLESDVADIAAHLAVSQERVARVLRTLQDIGPAGIGARSMRECLLLQIDRMEPREPMHALLRTVVADHWDDFAAHRYTELSRTLGVSYDALVQIRDLIRRRLQPYPLALGGDGSGREAAPLPDVVIIAEGDRFVVDVAESRRYALRLNPLYQELSRKA